MAVRNAGARRLHVRGVRKYLINGLVIGFDRAGQPFDRIWSVTPPEKIMHGCRLVTGVWNKREPVVFPSDRVVVGKSESESVGGVDEDGLASGDGYVLY